MYTAPESPRSIGGVIDDAIQLAREGFGRSWSLALVGSAIGLAVGAWYQMQVLDLRSSGASAAAVLAANPRLLGINYLVQILCFTLMQLAIVQVMLRIARGAPGGSAWSELGPSMRRLPAALLGLFLSLVGITVGFVLLIVPGLWLMIRWLLFFPALLDGERGPLQALGTSFERVRGHWWRTFAIICVLGIIVMIVAMVPMMIFGMIAGLLDLDVTSALIGTTLVGALTQVIYVPAMCATLVAIYRDLGLRREGSDLEARLGRLESASA